MARRGSTAETSTRGAAFRHAVESTRRAFAEFLTIPTLVIAAFLALGALLYYLDRLRIERGWPSFVPGTHESVSTLLGTIATSIITVTSITFSLLLIAVQQGAAALTSQVYDQFLLRRANQVYFGFFIGLALYCLIILATVNPGYTPVYGAAVGFALTVVALYLLVLLIYSTIDQMRPVMIVQTIRDHTLAARKAQRKLLAATRPAGTADGLGGRRLRAKESGFLTSIDTACLAELGRKSGGAAEIVLLRSIGDYCSVGEELLELRYGDPGAADCDEALLGALELEQQRDLASDPGSGIEQLATIGWTSGSTSKSNPQPAILACWSLRDLLASWYPPDEDGEPEVERAGDESQIVYTDVVPRDLLRAFESLAVVASESMQHQTLAEVYRALTLAMKRMPPELCKDIEAIVLRSLAVLGDHALTAQLDDAISELGEALHSTHVRAALKRARDRLAESRGTLNSRATRVSY